MTIYYFIRHGEKQHLTFGSNPHLTKKGRKQANTWAKVLADKNIEMIYSTKPRRTRETAQPLADTLNIEIELYDTSDLYNAKFQQETRNKTVLVVGHQVSIPDFVNQILRERRYNPIESPNHGNLYKVTVDNKGNTDSELTHINLD